MQNTLLLTALCGLAAHAPACPPSIHPCPHAAAHPCIAANAPTPQIVCHTPPSADLPRGARIVMPPPAAPTHFDGAITFSITFEDGGLFAPWHAQLVSHIQAAGQLWAQHLGGSGSIEIVVRPQPGPRAAASSLSSTFAGNFGGFDLWMQGAAGELRTGVDPNGSVFDAQILFGQDLNYISNELWFDPDPFSRTAPVPSNRTDAMSVILHEFGHIWGFNGWRNWSTGQPPATYMSTFDRWVDLRPDFWFTGPASVLRWGADVSLTSNNIFHYGNEAPHPGSTLIPQLMNGVVFYRGLRYNISALEVATLADSAVILAPCYANCDLSTTAPILNVDDFTCFINNYAAASSLPHAQQITHYANCDGSTIAPALNVDDFTCFINAYAQGCP